MMNAKRARWWVVCLLTFLLSLQFYVPLAIAQEIGGPSNRFRESVSLDTDIAVTKKLKTAEDYLAARQWKSAIQVLDDIIEGDSETLVGASTGRYIGAGAYCHLLLSRLPANGLMLYRRRTDPQARQWFERGSKAGDASALQRVLSQAYVSSFGDDALLTLGDWAWERGEQDVARRYWKQLLPADDTTPGLLRYPDPDVGGGEIVVRLLLCSLAEGDFARAERERLLLLRHFPDATGRLAGQTGNLADLAATVMKNARQWTFPAKRESTLTFAGSARRNQVTPAAVDVGAEQWSVPFSGRETRRFKFPSRQPAFAAQRPLSVYPVIHDGVVLFNDADRIYAYDLKSGKPAWPGPTDEADNAVIYQLRDQLFPMSSRAAVGVPRYSMTVHNGRLYARMGTPVTSRSERELIAAADSALVVLDLDPNRGQGKLLAKISAKRIGRGASPWSFEGSPVVANDRIYIALCRSQPQMQINVACFASESGRLIWNRKVCAAVSNIGRVHNLISHQLLTLAEDKIFVSTDLGAVAALNARDGALLWIVTYESRQPKSPAVLSDHTRQGLLPCLYHREMVYCAPNDSDRVFAIDAQSGVVQWKRQLNDHIRHLIGVGAGNLVVGGNSLWGLNARTGELAWGRESTDPEFYGFGRGLLVDDAVWWPTRDTIEIRSPRTGRRIHRQPILLSAHGSSAARHTGGNLVIADRHLLVAQADRLVVYGESSSPNSPRKREVSAMFAPRLVTGASLGPTILRLEHLVTPEDSDEGNLPRRSISSRQKTGFFSRLAVDLIDRAAALDAK